MLITGIVSFLHHGLPNSMFLHHADVWTQHCLAVGFSFDLLLRRHTFMPVLTASIAAASFYLLPRVMADHNFQHLLLVHLPVLFGFLHLSTTFNWFCLVYLLFFFRFNYLISEFLRLFNIQMYTFYWSDALFGPLRSFMKSCVDGSLPRKDLHQKFVFAFKNKFVLHHSMNIPEHGHWFLAASVLKNLFAISFTLHTGSIIGYAHINNRNTRHGKLHS